MKALVRSVTLFVVMIACTHALGLEPPLPGDVNLDGSVDFEDFIILKQNYNTVSGATWAMGDFNGDEAVNIDDFILLKRNYGTQYFIGKQIYLDCGGGVMMTLVKIPAGTFMMGSLDTEQDRHDREGPQHQVTLTQPFYMGIYEVTQEQYLAVTGSNPSFFVMSGLDAPVEEVKWSDADAFCEQLSLSTGMNVELPTEAQWEYACRAGTQTRYPFGDDPDYTLLDSYAWYNGNSDQTHSVGEKNPNGWGLYDMHGNVCEWVRDLYADRYDVTDNVDPSGPQDGQRHIHRGGGWSYWPTDCRSAARWDDPNRAYKVVGFRVVILQEPDE